MLHSIAQTVDHTVSRRRQAHLANRMRSIAKHSTKKACTSAEPQNWRSSASRNHALARNSLAIPPKAIRLFDLPPRRIDQKAGTRMRSLESTRGHRFPDTESRRAGPSGIPGRGSLSASRAAHIDWRAPFGAQAQPWFSINRFGCEQQLLHQSRALLSGHLLGLNASPPSRFAAAKCNCTHPRVYEIGFVEMTGAIHFARCIRQRNGLTPYEVSNCGSAADERTTQRLLSTPAARARCRTVAPGRPSTPNGRHSVSRPEIATSNDRDCSILEMPDRNPRTSRGTIPAWALPLRAVAFPLLRGRMAAPDRLYSNTVCSLLR